MARLDLVGERFGRLVVVAFNGIDNRRASRWLCKCDCGNTKVIGRAALKQGNTHSCGCIKEEREERHKPEIGNLLTKRAAIKAWNGGVVTNSMFVG